MDEFCWRYVLPVLGNGLVVEFGNDFRVDHVPDIGHPVFGTRDNFIIRGEDITFDLEVGVFVTRVAENGVFSGGKRIFSAENVKFRVENSELRVKLGFLELKMRI